MYNPGDSAPFGLWPSPLTPALLAQSKRLQDVAWDDQRLVWLEGRSAHGVLVALDPGEASPRDLTPDLSVRARVGYGGGDFGVAGGQAVFAADGRLYRQSLISGAAQAITPAFGAWASPTFSPDARWVVAVQSHEGTDCLALVDVAGQRWPARLSSGADFYMQPAWHPQGTMLAWIEWDHPNMPWDGTRLMLARVAETDDGGLMLADVRQIAGGPEIAVQQPRFAPDGRSLAYISDEMGWSGLYVCDLASARERALVNGAYEIGLPSWVQGIRTYGWAPQGDQLYYLQHKEGRDSLCSVEAQTGQTRVLPGLEMYTSLGQIAVAAGGQIAVQASSASVPGRLIVYEPAEGTQRIVARSSGETTDEQWLSTPQAITWTSLDGQEAHGVFYPPAPALQGSGQPPLLVRVHGGPTGESDLGFASQIQFFASRGYAVLDVNYRGSTGYGREYMLALREHWGIYDVQDTVSGAQHLAAQGLCDPGRMVVMGGSAGGYTVLQCLVHHPGVFKAGICMYGVTNLFTLASDTHKFEARYLDSMIGPLPETADRYRDRSPIFFAEQIKDPIAVFQGDEDPVVPPDQAETIVAALQRSGTPHEYHVFAGEGHGWRKADTIDRFYSLVLRFLKQYVIYS